MWGEQIDSEADLINIKQRDRREEIRVDGNAIKTSAVDIIKWTRIGDFDFALCRCSHDAMLKFAEL